MEGITHQVQKYKDNGIFQKLVTSTLNGFKRGRLTMCLPNDEQLTFGQSDEIIAQINVKNTCFFKKCALSADIGFGESYTDGDWESPDVCAVIKWALLNVESSGVISGSKYKKRNINWLAPINKISHYLNDNTLKGSKKNISFHYDLSNSFYQLMLESNMLYSCALFDENHQTLQKAQWNKINRLCQDLDLKPDDHVLEIGCGWGSFALYAAQNYQCQVTAITISQEQYDFAKKRIKDAKLEHKVEILLKDYRLLEGQYDKIVSIEMIEAVGHRHLPVFFAQCEKLLKPQGVLVMQAITSPDSRYDSFKKGVDWIQKHIFPGSLLPSIGALNNAAYKTSNFHLLNLRDIGLHYAKTLRLWRENFWENIEEVKRLNMDQYFIRSWHYYLSYCEAAFSMRNISDIQLTYTRPNNLKVHYEQV